MKIVGIFGICLAGFCTVLGVAGCGSGVAQVPEGNTVSNGTTSYVPRFTGTASLGNSQIYDNGTTIGIGVGSTPNALVKLDIGGTEIIRGEMILSRTGNARAATSGYPSYGLEFDSQVFNSASGAEVNDVFLMKSLPVGNNTANTSSTLNLFYSGGGALTNTGFSINPNGTINFAPGQTFPASAEVVGPAGPAGPAGPTGAQGLTGATGATGLTGGQVWSSNILFPATIADSSVVAGLPSGASLGSTTYADTVLPVPQTCTASNFTVNLLNTKGTSTATVLLTNTSLGVLSTDLVEGSSLACTITANNGQPVSCTSTEAVTMPANNFANILFFDFSNAPDFANARAYVSFTCQ